MVHKTKRARARTRADSFGNLDSNSSGMFLGVLSSRITAWLEDVHDTIHTHAPGVHVKDEGRRTREFTARERGGGGNQSDHVRSEDRRVRLE